MHFHLTSERFHILKKNEYGSLFRDIPPNYWPWFIVEHDWHKWSLSLAPTQPLLQPPPHSPLYIHIAPQVHDPKDSMGKKEYGTNRDAIVIMMKTQTQHQRIKKLKKVFKWIDAVKPPNMKSFVLQITHFYITLNNTSYIMYLKTLISCSGCLARIDACVCLHQAE